MAEHNTPERRHRIMLELDPTRTLLLGSKRRDHKRKITHTPLPKSRGINSFNRRPAKGRPHPVRKSSLASPDRPRTRAQVPDL
jgi:hypothetical protein